MKKLLVALVLPMFTIGGFAQEKLFKEAVQKGRSTGSFYQLENSKGKALSIEKIKSFAKENGYITGNYTTKSISRFGDVSSTISTLEFLPKSEYASYIYENLRDNSALNLDRFTNKGEAYIYLQDNQSGSYFWKADNVSWTGSLSGNSIQGEGSGFLQMGNDALVFFNGKFDKGIPQGVVSYKLYSLKGELDKYSSSKVKKSTTKVGSFHEGLAQFEHNGKYGFINEEAKTVISPKFESVVEGFTNNRATVMSDNKEVWIDKTGKIISLTDHQKELIAAAEKKRQEEERQARIAEQERLKQEEIAALKKREQEKLAEQRRLAQIKQDVELKKNCVGKKITWHESISFNTSGGGLGGILLGAVGLGTTDYDIEYTAIVESIIGEDNVKAIVTKARICDPSFVSANYLKYKGYAREEMNKAVGQTRVMQFSEFKLAGR